MTNKTEIYCTRYRKPGWGTPFVAISTAAIEVLLEELTYAELAMYIFIAKNERTKTRASKVSYRYLQNGMGCSSSTIRKGLKNLMDLKLIEKVEGGYMTRYHESVESWRELLAASKIEEDELLRKSKNDCSKIEEKPLRKSRQSKETNTTDPSGLRVLGEERGEEAAATPRPTPSEPIASRKDRSNLLLLPWVKDSDEEVDPDILEELEVEHNIASIKRNPVIYRKILTDRWEFPESYLPVHSPRDNIQYRCGLTFLQATNLMCDLLRQRGAQVYTVPTTKKDVEKLGEVLAAFLHYENWKQIFSEFLWWMYENKNNHSFNFLASHLDDWNSAVLSAGRDLELRSMGE